MFLPTDTPCRMYRGGAYDIVSIFNIDSKFDFMLDYYCLLCELHRDQVAYHSSTKDEIIITFSSSIVFGRF